MSERKAIVLAFMVFGLVVVATYIGLTIAGVKEEILVTALFLIACFEADVLSRIVLHYAPPEERGPKARR